MRLICAQFVQLACVCVCGGGGTEDGAVSGGGVGEGFVSASLEATDLDGGSHDPGVGRHQPKKKNLRAEIKIRVASLLRKPMV